MQIYLVGGAVRDQLLARPIKDKDFVVVGATVAEMLDAGFQQVGADFPVFCILIAMKNTHWHALNAKKAWGIKALAYMPVLTSA